MGQGGVTGSSLTFLVTSCILVMFAVAQLVEYLVIFRRFRFLSHLIVCVLLLFSHFHS
jgi:hypothetical protein